MAWKTPQNWSAESINDDKLNEEIRDNTIALHDPPTDLFTDTPQVSDIYSTTSTTFGNVDTNFNLALTTYGGDVMLIFDADITGTGYFDVLYDNARIGGPDGILALVNSHANIYWLLQDVLPGAHTFNLQWKAASGTMTLRGTNPPQFTARETS